MKKFIIQNKAENVILETESVSFNTDIDYDQDALKILEFLYCAVPYNTVERLREYLSKDRPFEVFYKWGEI